MTSTMTGATVEELDARIQQLSSGDQLWLLERLVQHIRNKINDAADPVDEKSEPSANGAASLLQRPPTQPATADIEEDEELAEESGIFYLNPDSPLLEDMKQILADKKQGRLKFYSYEEVFGE